MGKKVISKGSPSSICKNDEKKQRQQQQLRSVIKELRPKVYITDTSNFKQLVQELTGNNARKRTVPPLPCGAPSPEINKQEDYRIQGDQESCMEVSFDASFDSLESWNHLVLNDEINQSWNQIYEDANPTNTAAAFDSSENPHVDLSVARELEGWLLDVELEPCSSDKNGHLHQIEQYITII